MRPCVGTRDALRVEPIGGPWGPGLRGPPGRWSARWVLGKARGPVVTGMGVGGADWGGLGLGSEPWQRAAEQGWEGPPVVEPALVRVSAMLFCASETPWELGVPESRHPALSLTRRPQTQGRAAGQGAPPLRLAGPLWSF